MKTTILLFTNCKRAFQLALVLSIAVLMTACQGVNHLREAQDSFNAAAALENKVRLEPMLSDPGRSGELDAQLSRSPGDVLTDANTIRSGYASVLLSLAKISREDETSLKSNRLWGVALTLRALTQWRLGQYDEALKTADSAQKEAKDQIFPRDEAVLLALPGLIKIDLAYEQISAMSATNLLNGGLSNVQARLVSIPGQKDECAVKDLTAARIKVGATHPLNLYLIQAQLAAFRNYQFAHAKAYGTNPPATDPAKMEAQYELFELDQLLGTLKAPKTIVSAWKNNYSIVPTKRP
jgi:hypothetical protein